MAVKPADRLAQLARTEGTAKALAAWMESGAKKPRRDYAREWRKKKIRKPKRLL